LQNPTHTFTGTGTYTVTLNVSTDKGCQATAFTNQVTVNPRPKAGFMMPQACTGDQAAPFTDTSKVEGGTIVAWEWNFGDVNATPGNPNTSTLQNPTHWFTVMGNYTVQLISTSNTGCKDTVQQTLFVNGNVLNADFQVRTPGTLCSNKELVIEDASNVEGTAIRLEIFWDYSNDPTIKTTVNDPVAGTQYTHTYPEFGIPATRTYQVRYVVYTGENCINSVTRDITFLATPTLEFTSVPAICSDAPSFQVTQAQMTNGLPGGPGVFSGTGITAGGMFSPATAGAGQHLIRFSYEGTNGCSNFIEQTIEVNPTPGANAGPDKVVLEGGQVMLTPAQNASMPVTYSWTPVMHLNNASIAQPLASPIDDITYTLTVTSDKGCADSDDVFVKVLKSPAIPNIFSPNGDGIHDKWVIQYLETYPGCTVDIYNRYGQIVFHSVGYTTAWDGTVNGKPVPVGTYYYIVNPKNGRGQMSGYVDVIR
jgi:gliding motility-associated-like protein